MIGRPLSDGEVFALILIGCAATVLLFAAVTGLRP